MRYFWLGCIIFFTIQSQQPPSSEASLQKSLEMCQSLSKLRKSYQDMVDTNFTAVQAYLLQKNHNAPDLGKTDFSCIIDQENDRAILDHLTQSTQLILRIHELEEKLEKTDNNLTQNPTNVLELWREHDIDQEISALNTQLFATLMQLAYRQAIRTYQKAAEIRGALPHLPKR